MTLCNQLDQFLDKLGYRYTMKIDGNRGAANIIDFKKISCDHDKNIDFEYFKAIYRITYGTGVETYATFSLNYKMKGLVVSDRSAYNYARITIENLIIDQFLIKDRDGSVTKPYPKLETIEGGLKFERVKNWRSVFTSVKRKVEKMKDFIFNRSE